MKRVLIWVIFIFGLTLLVGCTSPKQTELPDCSSTQTLDFSLSETPYIEFTPLQTSTAKPEKFSAWVAYWDMEGVMSEACEIGNSLGSLSFFAAYFDVEGELFVPEEISILLEESRQLLSDVPLTRYITVVNDKLNSEGPTSLKDVDLLYSLLESDDTINAHIEDLITLAKNGGYDGIEIDYERIRDDLALWDRFLTFVNRLNLRAAEAGLNLRVLLEPPTPFGHIDFPEGPEYVMMCYNLYGKHSGPGPKADAKFIRQLAEQMMKLPGKKVFAIATGGFDWERSGSVVQITEVQAAALQDGYSVQARRDEASMCVVFNYKDEENDLHEVWHADGITLRYWMDIIKEYDNSSVAIWRLGGNNSIASLLHE